MNKLKKEEYNTQLKLIKEDFRLKSELYPYAYARDLINNSMLDNYIRIASDKALESYFIALTKSSDASEILGLIHGIKVIIFCAGMTYQRENPENMIIENSKENFKLQYEQAIQSLKDKYGVEK